jgi:hypothetical protein
MSRVFAPYLLNYRNIKLSINGKPIDTNEIVARREEFPLASVKLRDGKEHTARIEIVECRANIGCESVI